MTLAASVLSREPETVADAIKMLETAIKAAPYLLDAVFFLVSLYDRQKQYDKAIQLLRYCREHNFEAPCIVSSVVRPDSELKPASM